MRNWRAKTAAIAAVSALALATAACSSENEEETDGGNGNGGTSSESPASELSGTLNGIGASSQESAQQAWIAGFLAQNPDVTVNYDPQGSGAGRENFISGGSDFSGSDAYLDDEELASAQERCPEVIEVPAYVSPIAVVFNLPGVEHLNLTPDTIARIFTGEITAWNDEAIAETNPDVELPDTEITAVHRADDSGTTENFTDYLFQTAPDVWTNEPDGEWPLDGGEAANQTSGVIDTVTATEGAVTYADASRAGELGTAQVQVGEEFVAYSPEAAAAIVEVSERVEGRGQYDFAYDLARTTTESTTYPIVLVSYLLACQTYDDENQANLVRSYLSYIVSEEGQQAAAEAAGSAPISDALRQQIQPAIDAITAG
jgi:phosphate transport system substrate-binding protein